MLEVARPIDALFCKLAGRSSPSTMKRQVPLFALLESAQRMKTIVRSNNAKGGS
jgi:hypothetical protein